MVSKLLIFNIAIVILIVSVMASLFPKVMYALENDTETGSFYIMSFYILVFALCINGTIVTIDLLKMKRGQLY